MFGDDMVIMEENKILVNITIILNTVNSYIYIKVNFYYYYYYYLTNHTTKIIKMKDHKKKKSYS